MRPAPLAALLREIDAWIASESPRAADGAVALAASWGAR